MYDRSRTKSTYLKGTFMNTDAGLKPTPGELKILRILWTEGPSTVRNVHHLLHESEGRGYTTTLKQLQVMEQKGLVRRDTTHRSHIYAAVIEQHQVQQHLVDELIKSAFGGSAKRLMVHLAESEASADMLAEVQRLIEAKERQKND
jgi:predicted transcriptional regulator